MTGPAGTAARETKIHEILDGLFRERRGLRSTNVDPGLLEANRLAIVYWQRQLSPATPDAGPGTQGD